MTLKVKNRVMDIDLLSKMVKELILDKDRVALPGLGCFVAEMVPSTFSDKGYTINPPYRKLSFRSRPDKGDELIDFYVKANGVDREVAVRILGDYLRELKQVIYTKKVVVLPGLGRLRATKENNLFFIPDEDLDIYPAGIGLEPISLKTHVETPEEVAAALSGLKSIMDDVLPADAPVVESEPETEQQPESVSEPVEESVVSTESVEEPIAETVEDAIEETIEEPAAETTEESNEETTASAVESEVAEPEPAPATPVAKPKKKRSAGMKFLLTIIILVFVAALLLAAYVIVARQIPGFFDTILYTPEELEILNYKL